MKALAYLILIQIKNKILALRKKPGLMIFYLIILLILIGSMISLIAVGDRQTIETYVDDRILFLFLSGFALLYVFTFIYSGLSTGSTFFTMADVGLLFVAPISNKKILLYGLLSTIGKTMITSIFIIYQIPNLKRMFGYGWIEILALFSIYVIMVIFCQILSIGVYIFSNGNQKRKNLIRMVLYLLASLIIISTYLIMQREQVGIMEALKLLFDRKWFGYLPVMGWVIMFFKGILMGSIIQVMISLSLFVVTSVMFISILTRDADYYEDVLYSTEVQFQRIKDYKERRNISTTTVNRKVKIKENENGLHKGKGALIFAYKHLLEMKRSSRLLFIDSQTVFMTIGVGIAGYSIKNDMSSYIILACAIYLQYFMTLLGRLKIELMKPYIYMIPESSLKKLLSASISSMLKPCIDSVFIFGALALVGGAGILQCIFMALAYSCSGAIFVGLTVLYQRVLGGQPNKLIKAFIGLFLMLIIFTPSIIVSILFALFVIPESMQFLSTLPYSIINLLFAFLIFYSCRNLLDNAEISDGIL